MRVESDAKFEEKLALGFKNDMTNLVNFNASSGKSENLHFDVLLLSIAYIKFQRNLGKSEKSNNQGMKENKAFRIPFITKKQLKSRQVLHRIFLKHQYKVYRGASILYFNASFSEVLSFSKISQRPG